MMAERGLSVDHSTIARWVLRFAPVLKEALAPACPSTRWFVAS